MNYAQMSDFEINRKVLEIELGVKALGYAHAADGVSAGWVRSNQYHWYDYCNSWADAGPIIAENQISLVFDADRMIEPPAHWVMCRHVNNNGDVAEHYAQPNKPLRAAMIVFLMMQEGK